MALRRLYRFARLPAVVRQTRTEGMAAKSAGVRCFAVFFRRLLVVRGRLGRRTARRFALPPARRGTGQPDDRFGSGILAGRPVYAAAYAADGRCAESGGCPLNVLAVTLPALAVAELLRYAVRRFLPPNLFLYIFINGFFCAAAGMMATGAAITALLSQSTVFAAVDLWQQAFPVFFLISWGEAFLTGMFTAIFVALKPQLLLTFDDDFYLNRQNSIWPSES